MKKLFLLATMTMSVSTFAMETYQCRELNYTRENYTVTVMSKSSGRIKKLSIIRDSDSFTESFKLDTDTFESDYRPALIDPRSPLDEADLIYAQNQKYKFAEFPSSEELYVSESILAKKSEGIIVLVDRNASGPIGRQTDLSTILRCRK